MKRFALAVATATILGLGLTGCAAPLEVSDSEVPSESPSETPREHYSFEQELPDGTTVLCIWASAGYEEGTGLSCDWESRAKLER